MAELSGRLQKAALQHAIRAFEEASQSEGADDLPIDWLKVTGEWRVSFQRLARLHQARFPDCTTDDSRFDAQRLPAYLREGSAYDRGDIGLGNGADGKPPLESFGVYDATRRAMNCLALLYTPASAYLLSASQDALVTMVLQDAVAPPAEGPGGRRGHGYGPRSTGSGERGSRSGRSVYSTSGVPIYMKTLARATARGREPSACQNATGYSSRRTTRATPWLALPGS